MSSKTKPAKITPLSRATLKGVWCALIVPWTARDEVDGRRMIKEVRGYGGTGVNGVYTGGTTGEFYAQDDATFEKITQIVCDEAHAISLPVQIGVSALSTRTVRRRIRVALRAKADALQIALPFWLELKDDEVKRFVSEVVDEAGKTPIVAAVETTAARKPRRIRLTVVKGFRKNEVEKIAKRDFMPGSNVVSDGLSCWPAVERAGCRHFPMRTGSGRQAARWAAFAWVNTTLGNIKTALAGTYHHVSAKHAQSYLASFAYRFNRRHQLDSIVERLAWAAVRTAPHTYRAITADA